MNLIKTLWKPAPSALASPNHPGGFRVVQSDRDPVTHAEHVTEVWPPLPVAPYRTISEAEARWKHEQRQPIMHRRLSAGTARLKVIAVPSPAAPRVARRTLAGVR